MVDEIMCAAARDLRVTVSDRIPFLGKHTKPPRARRRTAFVMRRIQNQNHAFYPERSLPSSDLSTALHVCIHARRFRPWPLAPCPRADRQPSRLSCVVCYVGRPTSTGTGSSERSGPVCSRSKAQKGDCGSGSLFNSLSNFSL